MRPGRSAAHLFTTLVLLHCLTFERNDARDSRGRIQHGVEWIGGSVEVLR